MTAGRNRNNAFSAFLLVRKLISNCPAFTHCLYQWSTNPSLFAVTCNFTVGAGLSSSWGQWPECPAMKQRYYGTMGVVLCTESELFQEKALKTRSQTMYSSCDLWHHAWTFLHTMRIVNSINSFKLIVSDLSSAQISCKSRLKSICKKKDIPTWRARTFSGHYPYRTHHMGIGRKYSRFWCSIS